MLKIFFIASIFLLGVDLALTAPSVPEYRYITPGKEVRRSTSARPVTFNGVAIGTTELNSIATPGTIHSLLDGHHFYQRGWYLSHTDTDEPVWEYLPDHGNQSSTQPVKRQSGTISLIIDHQSLPYISGAMVDYINIYDNIGFTVTEASWSTVGVGEMFLDLFDDGAFVTSSSSLFGDLAGIFFNALEIFA